MSFMLIFGSKNHHDMKNVFLLGAGASKSYNSSPTGQRMPIANDFFSTYSKLPINFDPWALKTKLLYYLNLRDGLDHLDLFDFNEDIENLHSEIQIKAYDIIKANKNNKSVEEQVTLGAYYELIFLFIAGINQIQNGPISQTHLDLAKLVTNDDAIITFNWDTLMDRALMEVTSWNCDTGYYVKPLGVYRDKWMNTNIKSIQMPRLLKLHGSSNWLTSYVTFENGKEIKLPIKEIVIGDTVILSAGSMIPADLRIIEAKDLYVSQSSLTGESDAVKKQINSQMQLEEIDNISDLDTICFMGTNVISGSAKGIVIKTADSTYFGQIAHTLSGKPKTSFQKGIESISKLLIRFMIILIPLIFVLNAWKHDNLTAFTFAVAIAIGITPLLLPVILSSCLSKGAVRMSKKKTIVKKLDSIQSLGGMNILCTDKTGTLTEDKIVLEKYLNINGDEDLRILKHAFLNSYFQTGLKGNIDEAVIERGLKNGMDEIKEKYKIIDEIPFDFSRRRLSVIVTDGTKKQMITKGAVEEILSICTMVDYKGEVTNITNKIKENIKKISKSLNKDGLRVVAVCQKNDINDIQNFDVSIEKNMVLLGFIGFLDPPKESAKESIEKLNKAGIRVIVLTGDNSEVTRCVCNKVGIKSKNIVLGSEIDKLQDLAVIRLLKKTNIFAKLSPIQKARIVRLLKDSGNIVGYMGDGINDSPSLTNSDVGVSVDTAVDIAKESADIILLEKDLNVLLDGVTERKKNFW